MIVNRSRKTGTGLKRDLSDELKRWTVQAKFPALPLDVPYGTWHGTSVLSVLRAGPEAFSIRAIGASSAQGPRACGLGSGRTALVRPWSRIRVRCGAYRRRWGIDSTANVEQAHPDYCGQSSEADTPILARGARNGA